MVLFFCIRFIVIVHGAVLRICVHRIGSAFLFVDLSLLPTKKKGFVQYMQKSKMHQKLCPFGFFAFTMRYGKQIVHFQKSDFCFFRTNLQKIRNIESGSETTGSAHKTLIETFVWFLKFSHSLRSQVCVRFESHYVIDPLLHNEILMAALKN